MLDKVVSSIVALGVPGLVLLVAMAASGWAGGAAIVTALATLGGPGGMLGGIGVLIVMALISKALADYGFERLFVASVKGLREKGMSNEEIIRKVEGYPISRSIKLRLYDELKKLEE